MSEFEPIHREDYGEMTDDDCIDPTYKDCICPACIRRIRAAARRVADRYAAGPFKTLDEATAWLKAKTDAKDLSLHCAECERLAAENDVLRESIDKFLAEWDCSSDKIPGVWYLHKTVGDLRATAKGGVGPVYDNIDEMFDDMDKTAPTCATCGELRGALDAGRRIHKEMERRFAQLYEDNRRLQRRVAELERSQHSKDKSN